MSDTCRWKCYYEQDLKSYKSAWKDECRSHKEELRDSIKSRRDLCLLTGLTDLRSMRDYIESRKSYRSLSDFLAEIFLFPVVVSFLSALFSLYFTSVLENSIQQETIIGVIIAGIVLGSMVAIFIVCLWCCSKAHLRKSFLADYLEILDELIKEQQ